MAFKINNICTSDNHVELISLDFSFDTLDEYKAFHKKYLKDCKEVWLYDDDGFRILIESCDDKDYLPF